MFRVVWDTIAVLLVQLYYIELYGTPVQYDSYSYII